MSLLRKSDYDLSDLLQMETYAERVQWKGPLKRNQEKIVMSVWQL